MKIASYIQIIAGTTLLLGLAVFSLFGYMYQQNENIAKQHFQAQISLNNFSHFVVLSKGWLTAQDLFFSGHQSYLANGINEQSEQLILSLERLMAAKVTGIIINELTLLKQEIIQSNNVIVALAKLSEPNNDFWLSKIELSDKITSEMVIRIDNIHSAYKYREAKLTKQLVRTEELFLQRTIVIAISYLLAIFLIVFWMIRSLVKPVQSLTEVATSKAESSNVNRFILSSGPVEIIRLGEALHQFIEQINLEKQIAQWERLNTLNASNRLSLIMNTAPIAIVLVDRDGIIRDINPETEQLFNTDKRHIKGERLFKFIPSMATLETTFDRHYVVNHNEETLLSSDLKERYVEFTGKYLLIEEQDYFLICISDIDEKKRNEKALERLNEQLIQSEKMASLGQLSAGVAHEINNPIGYVNSNLLSLEQYLNSLKIYIDAAKTNKKRTTLDEIYKNEDLAYVLMDIPELIKASQEGIERVVNIVKDLGVYSHNESLHKTLVNVNELIEKSLALVASELKNKAVIHKKLDCNAKLLVYPQKFLQVFINLFVNASHAIDGQGEIYVSSTVIENTVVIIIKDTGCGVADEHKTKLFDPFFTTKPVGAGTGLGLHIVHNIVTEHNGSLKVKSKLGEGTAMIIELPIDKS